MRAISLLLALLAGACGGEAARPASSEAATPASSPPPRAPRGTPVILVSIDTLRSDRLPAYGHNAIETPAIDRLRSDAILIERAYTHVGLTLPSHASILTGLAPPEHGLRDNLAARFDPPIATLPALLRENGFATGGFVSAYVLRRATGIDHGFEIFDDEVPMVTGRELGALQRDGNETLDVALGWLDTVADRPFFLFLHLYEPHSPYDPAEPFASRYRDPYDAEVAEADAIVGRLLDRLSSLDLYDRSLIVLLSDHGEGLGDHGEQEHEILIYREVLQVPLLLKLPASERGGSTVGLPVQLSDVAPTVYDLLAVDPPGELSGRSIFALDPRPREIFSESLYPRLHFGWSELVSVIRGDLHLIAGVAVELFDLAADPGEARDLAEDRPQEVRQLRRALRPYDRTASAPAAVDPEVRRALESLGYLTSSSAAGAESDRQRPDPRSKIHLLEEIGEASRLMLAGKHAAAASALRDLSEQEPEMTFAWEQLGKAERRAGRQQAALVAYRRALELSGGAPQIFLSLAELHLARGELREAATHAERALPVHEAAHDLLAQVALRRDDLDAAERHLEAALATRGRRIAPLVTQTELLVRRERYLEALGVARLAEGEFGDRPDRSLLRGLAFQKGHAYTALGRLKEADAAYRAEIERSPEELEPYAFLAFALALDERPQEVAATLQQMLRTNDTPAAHAMAVQTLRALGDPESARRLLATALRRWPEDAQLLELR